MNEQTKDIVGDAFKSEGGRVWGITRQTEFRWDNNKLSYPIYNIIHNSSFNSINLMLWRKDCSMWKVLNIFYYHSKPLWFKEIQNLSLNEQGKWIVRPTLKFALESLKDEALIRKVAVNAGPNKRRTYYMITERGIGAYEAYMSKK